MTVPITLLLLLQVSGAPVPVEFTAPPGWVAVEAPPLRAFTPTDLAPGQALLVAVWPTERINLNVFPNWFETRLNGPGETVLQQGPTERRPRNGLEVLTATQRVALPQLGPVVRVLYAIGAGDRVALAMLTANQDELVTRYAEPVRAFFESLRFSGATATSSSAREGGRTPIPAAGFEGSQPRGLFYRLRSGGSSRMETQTRLFLPPNRILLVSPMGSGERIDLARCSPDTCGTYTVAGGFLMVRWDNNATQRLRFVRSADGFTLDGDTFQPARPVAAAEIVGSWGDPSNAGSSASGLKFSVDERFEWGAGSRETTLRGRYELKGMTLTLNFTDGTTKDYALFAAGRTRPAGLLSLDGTVFSRTGR